MNDGKEYNVTITNSIGQAVSNLKMTNHASVPVSSFAAGVYYVRITSSKERKTFTVGTLIK